MEMSHNMLVLEHEWIISPLYAILPIDELIFFKMVKTTNQMIIPIIIYIYILIIYIYYTLWLFNIAMEQGPFIDGFLGQEKL